MFNDFRLLQNMKPSMTIEPGAEIYLGPGSCLFVETQTICRSAA